MRELRMVKSGEYHMLKDKEDRKIACPIQSTMADNCYCFDHCAWFHVNEYGIYENTDDGTSKYFETVMCKDHTIGKLVSEFKDVKP